MGAFAPPARFDYEERWYSIYLQYACKFACYRDCYALKTKQYFQYSFHFVAGAWLWNAVKCAG